LDLLDHGGSDAAFIAAAVERARQTIAEPVDTWQARVAEELYPGGVAQ
jgi:hypothetical protein